MKSAHPDKLGALEGQGITGKVGASGVAVLVVEAGKKDRIKSGT